MDRTRFFDCTGFAWDEPAGRVIAPPFRRHGIAPALLDRVIADARRDSGHFRRPRCMYDERQFEPIAVRERATVMRMGVSP